MATFTTESGTTYQVSTDENLIPVIESLIRNKTRVRVYYGDKQTGKVWNEEYDVRGYIGRTTGNKSPILVYNKRSMGGGLLLTNFILRIVETNSKRVLYTYHNFQAPNVEVMGNEVYIDGEAWGRCKDEAAAKRLALKMA